jgi:hypothetical protein
MNPIGLHALGGQRRLAGTIPINRIQVLLDEGPVDARPQLRQRMVEVDDLIQTRPQPLCLTAVASFARPHGQDPPGSVSAAADHGRSRRSNFAGKLRVKDKFLANTLTCRSQDPAVYQGFLGSSQATT